MKFSTTLAVLSMISAFGATTSFASSSSSASAENVTSYLNNQAASVPQVWTAVSTLGLLSSTLVYQTTLNATHAAQLLSTADGQLTSLVLSMTNPLQQPTFWGNMSLSNYATPGTVLLATRGDTPTSVFVSTTTALFVIDVSLLTSPRVYRSPSLILAVSVAPTTGLLLVVQSSQLTWWNVSMARQDAPIALTTSLVAPATAQCGADGACWIGDSVATFVVVYTNSAVIQTMSMRTQWPTDAATAPQIEPVGGQRAVMTRGVRVGLLTSQQAGNLAMKWSVTQTMNSTALGVFATLGQTGLVVTGHNASVSLYDLAGGHPIGVEGTLPGMLARDWKLTTIEVDTSAQPYLLLASGVNCAASWELVDATGALASARPAWSVMDPLFVSRPGVTLPSVTAGQVLWYLERSSYSFSYGASVLSPRQQRTLATIQHLNTQGSLLSTVFCRGRVIAVVTSYSAPDPTHLLGFALEDAPTVVNLPNTIVATTIDPSTNALYTVEYVSDRLFVVHTLPLGASEPLMVAQWNVSSPSSLQPAQSTIFSASQVTFMSGSLFFFTQLRGNAGLSSGLTAVINTATGTVAYSRYYPQGYDVAFVDTVNRKLVVQSNITYLIIDAAGSAVTQTIRKAFSGGLVAQRNNRAIIQGQTYDVIDVTTGDVLLSRSALYPAFATNGDILECANPNFPTTRGEVQQFAIAANGAVTSVRRAVLAGVNCGSAPLQTPDGNIYFVGGVYSSGAWAVYLARVNWGDVSATPAVRIWNSFDLDTMTLVHDSTNQLMVISDDLLGWQSCVDLIEGTRLWATQSLLLNYAVVKTPQLTLPAASNVLWAGVPYVTSLWQATNLFDGTPIESFQLAFTGKTSWVILSEVDKLSLITVGDHTIARYDQLLVHNVSTPTAFRSALLPLFAATANTTLPIPQLTVPAPPSKSGDGSTRPFVIVGVAVGVLAMSIAGLAVVHSIRRRRRSAAASPMQYFIVGDASAEKLPLRTSAATTVA